MGATSLLNFVLVSDITICYLAYWSSDEKNEIEDLFARIDAVFSNYYWLLKYVVGSTSDKQNSKLFFQYFIYSVYQCLCYLFSYIIFTS